MFRKILFIVVLLYSATVDTSIVTWLPNSGFEKAENFNTKKLPCSKETVVFDDWLAESVKIESEVNVQELVLPYDGEIFLQNNADILLGSDNSDHECKERIVHYIENTNAAWNEPDVWSSSEMNEATPDAERIPCEGDIVIFPKDAQFSIKLPKEVQYVHEIVVGNTTYSNSNLFYRAVIDRPVPTQTFVLNEYQGTGIDFKGKTCRSLAGCACQESRLDIDCSLKYCPPPSCQDPIKPFGHCCQICGSFLSFKITDSFDMSLFKELVDAAVRDYKDAVVYHIGKISTNQVQVVVVDKGAYEGSSLLLLNQISYNLPPTSIVGNKEFRSSGSPLNKVGIGAKISVAMFFTVLMIFGGVYLYYYKTPRVNFNFIDVRPKRHHVGISRFHRRTESVATLTRRDSDADSPAESATAFRNPLYDSQKSKSGTSRLVEENLTED